MYNKSQFAPSRYIEKRVASTHLDIFDLRTNVYPLLQGTEWLIYKADNSLRHELNSAISAKPSHPEKGRLFAHSCTEETNIIYSNINVRLIPIFAPLHPTLLSLKAEDGSSRITSILHSYNLIPPLRLK